jgi:asparagine synthase (glutamine-hydrolysing)
MCGIAGVWTSGPRRDLAVVALQMGNAMIHRGPDDHGEWIDLGAGIALAHRRLSIVDLSPEGHQPMRSASGRYEIVFNGEVFNFQELRADLPGQRWRGHSDTEVMLAAFEHWGVEASVKRFVGMFAFALWDSRDRALYLCRDRLGIKPLYYGWCNRNFIFGSELKSMCAHPDYDPVIDRNSVALLMRHNYIPHPYSIYVDVKKLPPGTILKVTGAQTRSEPQAYWTARAAAEQGQRNPFPDDPAAAIEKLDFLLREAVRLRMLADVPIGAFLSGGVDSSTVVALMQSMSARPVRTFSIGFREDKFNEAHHARAVAEHLGTNHTELYVSPEEALSIVPELPRYYDEPFADSSQIPTYLVSQLARKSVTVSLSGDGGDELFAGYPRYKLTLNIWSAINRVPLRPRKVASRALRMLSPAMLETIYRCISPLLPRRCRTKRPGEQIQRLADLLSVGSQEGLYRSVLSHWQDPGQLVLGSDEYPTVLTNGGRQANLRDPVHRMMFVDQVSYLPDDILTKVDRASMACSLEARVPILDHRVVEFAWSLPLSLCVREGKEKWLLRQVLDKYVPSRLIERPKMGFAVPLGEWMRGPLRGWCEELLSPSRLRDDGIFDVDMVTRAWREHVTGKRNWHYHLWDVLMFQSWLELQRISRAAISTVR